MHAATVDLNRYTWICPKCGKVNGAWERFCTSDGTKRQDLVKCPNGHENLPFFRFCTTCGAPLNQALQPAGRAPGLDELKKLFANRPVDVKLKQTERKKLSQELRVGEYRCFSVLLPLGGFSCALLCTDEYGANYVVKMLHRDYVQLLHGQARWPTKLPSELERELEVLEKVARLNHPNIVKFVGLARGPEGPPAIAFEYCEGGSLRGAVESGGLGPMKAAEVIVQVADALAAIHRLGYAHGDVKPENILFSRDGVPRLADFNSARALASASRTPAPYTPGYAAPEHAETGRPVPGSDVWSLALVLYEAATGKPLLPVDELGYQEAIAKLEAWRKPRIETGDAELDRIIEECLKSRPEERPTMEQLEEKLLQYLWRRYSTTSSGKK